MHLQARRHEEYGLHWSTECNAKSMHLLKKSMTGPPGDPVLHLCWAFAQHLMALLVVHESIPCSVQSLVLSMSLGHNDAAEKP